MSGPSLSCAEALALADERHDRTLSREEDAALHRHLASCAACRAEAAAGDRVHAALLGEEAPPTAITFTDEVVSRLDRAPGPRTAGAPASGRLLRGIAALAGTGAVAALAVLVLPLDAAAESVRTLVPEAPSIPLPEVPPEVASFVGDLAGVLPSWAFALGATASLAAMAAFLVRRRPGERTG